LNSLEEKQAFADPSTTIPGRFRASEAKRFVRLLTLNKKSSVAFEAGQMPRMILVELIQLSREIARDCACHDLWACLFKKWRKKIEMRLP
jgi:hypothetical protein